MGFNTELLHGTKTGDPVTGATLTPVYQSSAFFQPSAEQHEKLFHNPEEFSVRTDAYGKMCLDVHPCKPEDGAK